MRGVEEWEENHGDDGLEMEDSKKGQNKEEWQQKISGKYMKK
jgi:hypothetical protein